MIAPLQFPATQQSAGAYSADIPHERKTRAAVQQGTDGNNNIVSSTRNPAKLAKL